MKKYFKQSGFVGVALLFVAALVGIAAFVSMRPINDVPNQVVAPSVAPEVQLLGSGSSTIAPLPIKTFLGLTDTPNTYLGQATKVVSVKSDETGLEFTTGGGGGGGTPAGSTGNVQYNNAGAFGAEAAFQYDSTNNYLGINQGTPAARLHLDTDALGTTQAITSGILLSNATAATSGQQQISPALTFRGNGWRSNSVAASNTVDFQLDVLPVTSGVPAGSLRIKSSIAGAAFSNAVTISSFGDIVATRSIYAVDGIFTGDGVFNGNFGLGGDLRFDGDAGFVGYVPTSNGAGNSPQWTSAPGLMLIGSTSALGTETWLGNSAGSGSANNTNTTFIGDGAGAAATGATQGTFIGYNAGLNATDAEQSVFVGFDSGNGATNAALATFLGYGAGKTAENAANAIFIGYNAGLADVVDLTTGGSAILIGNNTSTGGFINSIAIGNSMVNTKDDQILFDSAIRNWQISGVDYVMPSAIGGAGAVLTDVAGDGNLTWEDPGSGGGVVSVSGTSNRITSTGGATPVIDIASTYVGQTSLTTLGTITTGVWNGTAIANANLANSVITVNGTGITLGSSGTVTAAAGTLTGTTLNSSVVTSSLTSVGTIGTGTWQGTVLAGQYGGTGVANTSKTITLGGNLVTSGAFATTLTSTATTNVTLPTTGTLSTLAGSEAFTNKSVNGVTLVNGGTASLYLSQDGTYTTPSVTAGVSSIAGTGAQITASASTGAVTLSIPVTFTPPGSLNPVNYTFIQAGTTNQSAASEAQFLSSSAARSILDVGANASTITASNPMFSEIIRQSTFTEAATGTHAIMGALGIRAPILTDGAGATTNASTVYIDGAPTGTATPTNVYSLWVDSGNSRFDGTVTMDGFKLTTSPTNGYVLTSDAAGVGTWQAAGAGTVTSVSGTTNRITVATGTTTPVIDISASYVGQSSITTLGTITTGVWNGTTVAVANGGTGITSFGTGVATWLGTPSSANLLAAVTDETGTGVAVFGTSPTFTTNLTSPKIIGGTGTTSTLTLQTTSGVGTTNADMIFLVGNNGGTEALRISNAGAISTSFNISANNGLFSTLVRAGATSAFQINGRSQMKSSADGLMEFSASSGSVDTAKLVYASFEGAYVAKTGTYTITTTDRIINCTANTFTVTLPTAVGISGQEFFITNSGAGTITIGTTSSQTFTNVVATPTTLTLAAVGAYHVASDGANWVVL